MALTLTEKFRGEFAGKKMKTFEVTSDGSTTTITAGDLDMTYIEGVAVSQKADLIGTGTWNPSQITDGNEEVDDVTVTGAALGDFTKSSFSLDVTDLELYDSPKSANTVTAHLFNRTGGNITLNSGTIKAHVYKNVGFSKLSGPYIVFGPALVSTDVFMITVVGY